MHFLNLSLIKREKLGKVAKNPGNEACTFTKLNRPFLVKTLYTQSYQKKSSEVARITKFHCHISKSHFFLLDQHNSHFIMVIGAKMTRHLFRSTAKVFFLECCGQILYIMLSAMLIPCENGQSSDCWHQRPPLNEAVILLGLLQQGDP